MDFTFELEKLTELGMLTGSDHLMGEIMCQIHNLKEKLHLMSVIKVAEGLEKITKEYNLDGTKIHLKAKEMLGELILTADIDFTPTLEVLDVKTAETLILGYLSNIRFDIPFFDTEASYFFKQNGLAFTLNTKNFKENFIKTMVNKEIYVPFEKQRLELILNSQVEDHPNKIVKV